MNVEVPTHAVGVDLAGVEWESWTKPGAVGRVKLLYQNGRRFRLLELPPGFGELHWCEVPHTGYVLQGEFVVMFSDREVPCHPGMAFDIPTEPHRSRGADDSPTIVFVVDDVAP